MPSADAEWITEAKRAIDRAGSEKEVQDQLDHLLDINHQVDDLLTRLSELAASANVSRASGWPGLDAPARLATTITAAETSLGVSSWRSAKGELDAFVAAVDKDMRDAWQGQIARRTGDANQLQNLMGALAGVSEISDIARDLERANADLTRLRKKLPDDNAVATLQKAAELLSALNRRLPESVRIFALAAANDGADLTLLTGEVLEWLTTNNAIDRFRVVTAARRGAMRG